MSVDAPPEPPPDAPPVVAAEPIKVSAAPLLQSGKSPLFIAALLAASGILGTFLTMIGWFQVSSVGGSTTSFFGGILQLIAWFIALFAWIPLWVAAKPDDNALSPWAEKLMVVRVKMRLGEDKKFFLRAYGTILFLCLIGWIAMAGETCVNAFIINVCVGVPFGMGALFNIFSCLGYGILVFILHRHYKDAAADGDGAKTEEAKPSPDNI